MADKIEFPEDLDKWFKGKIREGVGTAHEHCDDFYRFKDYGIEHDSDGSWEAYTIIDEKPILAKKGLGSFQEAVEYFKHELSKKELADSEDCEIEEEHPDAPSFPEQDSGGMKLEIFFKSAEDLLGEYEYFQKKTNEYPSKQAFEQDKKDKKLWMNTVDGSNGAYVFNNNANKTRGATTHRSFKRYITPKAFANNPHLTQWKKVFNNAPYIKWFEESKRAYPSNRAYLSEEDIYNLPFDEIKSRIYQGMNPKKADFENQDAEGDYARSPLLSGFIPQIGEDGNYTGYPQSPFAIARDKAGNPLVTSDGKNLHLFKPKSALYSVPAGNKIVDPGSKPRYIPKEQIDDHWNDYEYVSQYRKPKKWIRNPQDALNKLLSIPEYRQALDKYNNMRSAVAQGVGSTKDLNKAYDYMQMIAHDWLKRYASIGAYFEILNGANTVKRDNKDYTVPVWYNPPKLNDMDYVRAEERPDENDPTKKVWVGDFRNPDFIEYKSLRDDNFNFDNRLYDGIELDTSDEYKYPYKLNQFGASPEASSRESAAKTPEEVQNLQKQKANEQKASPAYVKKVNDIISEIGKKDPSVLERYNELKELVGEKTLANLMMSQGTLISPIIKNEESEVSEENEENEGNKKNKKNKKKEEIKTPIGTPSVVKFMVDTMYNAKDRFKNYGDLTRFIVDELDSKSSDAGFKTPFNVYKVADEIGHDRDILEHDQDAAEFDSKGDLSEDARWRSIEDANYANKKAAIAEQEARQNLADDVATKEYRAGIESKALSDADQTRMNQWNQLGTEHERAAAWNQEDSDKDTSISEDGQTTNENSELLTPKTPADKPLPQGDFIKGYLKDTNGKKAAMDVLNKVNSGAIKGAKELRDEIGSAISDDNLALMMQVAVKNRLNPTLVLGMKSLRNSLIKKPISTPEDAINRANKYFAKYIVRKLLNGEMTKIGYDSHAGKATMNARTGDYPALMQTDINLSPEEYKQFTEELGKQFKDARIFEKKPESSETPSVSEQKHPEQKSLEQNATQPSEQPKVAEEPVSNKSPLELSPAKTPSPVQTSLDTFRDDKTSSEGKKGKKADENPAEGSDNSVKSVAKSASDLMQEWSDNGTHLIREPWKTLVLNGGSKESDPLTFRDDTGKILFDLRHL